MISDIVTWWVVAYALLSIAFVWYRYSLIALGKKRSGDFVSPVSVVVPFYNEDFFTLERTVRSIMNCNGEKELIVIDDGSEDKSVFADIQYLSRKLGFTALRYENNKGKRFAQVMGFKLAKNPIIVTVDSDTTLPKDALLNLIKPFSDAKVGATTGDVLLTNENKNFLTRLIATTYWQGLNIIKRSLSSYGQVTCCSGCLAAYRKEYLLQFIDEYAEQRFLGEPVMNGEDRHLTNLFLKYGYDAVFVKDAVCKTVTPDSIKGYLRQQLRWKRSFWRENWYILFNVNNRALVLSEAVFAIALNVLSLLIHVLNVFMLVFAISTGSFVFLGWFFGTLALSCLFNNLLFLFENPKGLLFSFPMAMLNDFVLYWLNIWAVLTFTDKRWVTR